MATGLELIISTICNATFCEPVYDNPLLDGQLTKKQAALQSLINDLNGKHLKVATYTNYPLSWVERSENGTLTGQGVAFVIMDVLRKRFNFTFEVVEPDRNFEVGGSRPEDSVIGLVNSSLVDMAAAFLPMLVKFRRKVTFSNYLDEGVWSMMLRRPKESATGSGLLAPFETNVWYLILAALISYVPCITLLTKLRAKIVRDGEQDIPLSPSFWFVYAAFIKQGTTLAPEANTTRLLFATWWIFIILLSSFYTANLTAFLTLSKFTLDIKNTADLYKKNYRWVAAEGGSIEYLVKDPEEDLYYLSRMVATGRAEFRSFTQDRDFLPLVLGGAVLVKEQTSIDHVMYADYLMKTREGVDESDRCTYVVAPEPFLKIPRAFAFPKNSYLQTLFDPVIVFLLQAGIVDFLQSRDLPSTKMCPLDLQSKDRKLRNSDLQMTYVIMGIGLATAGAVFITEVVLRRYINRAHNKTDTVPKTTKRKKSKKIRFKDRDDSRPPPYDSLFGLNARYKNRENAKKKIINGREYYVVDTISGDTRLIPVRTPSAFLYQ
ncbi:glutamate receptor ionotropic, delta-2 [Pectinophora gossypiella]|uniref:glutamate receptor ionotropic, delta-2 n=1 Tax=Pectinophora gossypiella TaxID=13191 RepID=UPI00214EE857|nr:glutamate receptor ionotropic, delta-2 [Pectinophora gossypiella]